MIEFFHRKFSIKGQLHFRKSHSVCLLPSSRLPLASSCSRTMRQKLSAASRLPLASSCLRTMRQKLSAASRLPLGGKLSLKATDEGQFHLRKVIRPTLPLFSPLAAFALRADLAAPCFPLWESLPNCRSKAIPASRVARSAERGLPKFPTVLVLSIRYLRCRTLMLPDMLRKQLSFLRRQRAPFLRKIIA